jgi:hypothetical protein
VGLKLNRPGESAGSPNAQTARVLSGHRLFLARVGWLTVCVVTIGLFISSIPAHYDWLINFADPDLKPDIVRNNLEATGISVRFYAAYLLWLSIGSAMIWVAVSVIIFWRRSDDWMALLTSLSLLTFGVFFLTDYSIALGRQYPAIQLPVNLVAFLGSVSFALFFYLFPNGRFVPRWTGWIPILWAVHEAAYYLFPSSPFNLDRSFPLLDYVVLSTFVSTAVGAQLYRYRHVSSPIQRQQTKWVVFGMVLAGLGAIGFSLPFLISPTLAQFGSPIALALEAGISGSLLLIPMSIGIAILHNRLWEIDIVINRALVYGALTASLALVYFAGVAVTQAIFRALTSQVQQPQLAIVVSTLVIAALFNPLRRRIQGFIDRRFYRRKYDAAKTLEAFSVKLRDETDLDALSDDLVGVVRETMQPAHVSLWLRPDPLPRGGEGPE